MVITKKPIANYGFLALSTIIFCNLNAMMAMIFEVKSLLTFAILFLSIGVSSLFLFHYKVQVLSNLMKLVLLFLLAFIFISTCSLLWDSSNLHSSTSLVKLYRNYFSTIIIIFTFYISTVFYIRRGEFTSLIRTFLIFFLFTTLFIAIAQVIGLTSIYSNVKEGLVTGYRQAGFFDNPNEAGSFANYTLVFILASYLYFRKWKVLILLFVPLALYSVFVSFSKAAFFVSVFLLLFFFLFSIGNIIRIGTRNRFSILLFISFISIIIFGVIARFNSIIMELDQSQQKRVVAIFALAQGEINERTTSERSVLFEHGWDKIKSSPIIGNGLGSFHRFNSGKKHIGVHNTYLLILGESGIIPFLIFILIFGMMVFKSFQITNPAIQFFVFGFMIVFFLSVAATGHNALYERVSNGLWGFVIGILSNIKRL